MSDRLYFEELSLERVLDIYEQEQAWGLVVSVGGQIPQNLAKPLHDRGARVLGTSPDDIDRAEDRHKFSSLLDDLGVDQPPWRELQSVKDAQALTRRPRIAPKLETKTTCRLLSWRRSQGDASRHTQTAAARETAAPRRSSRTRP